MKFSAIKSFRPSKTWIVLGAAVGIGLLAALGARSYLTGRVADLELKARGKNVSVVVAKTDLVKGAKLSTANLAVRPIPSEYAHSGAVSPDQFDRVDGQPLAFNAKAGEMILWSMLEGKKAPTFSARIEPGRRAITVPVDEISSISGMLEPGDLIDLMVTIDVKGKKATVPLLQTVQVMATGQRSVDDPKSGEKKTYSTVTLDTDVRQAQNVIVGRDSGRITALLRNPQDKKPLQGGQVDLMALLAPADVLNAVAARSSLGSTFAEVPVIYGGRAGKIPPEALRLGQYVAAGSQPVQGLQPVPAGAAAAALAAAQTQAQAQAQAAAGEVVSQPAPPAQSSQPAQPAAASDARK